MIRVLSHLKLNELIEIRTGREGMDNEKSFYIKKKKFERETDLLFHLFYAFTG